MAAGTATAEKKATAEAGAQRTATTAGTPANTAVPAPVITMTAAVATARKVVDQVQALAQKYIQSGELVLPKDYAINNALKSAWLVLQDVQDKDKNKALEVCTTHSLANALLDMIVQGLNPMKKQIYFVVYGKTLICQRSYFGSMAIAERVNPVIKDWGQAVVYEGDTFKYGIKNGKKTVTEHIQDIENVDKANIVAAYSIALDKDGNSVRTEIMTFDEIKQAWAQSKVKPIDERGEVKADSTHGKFASDMAIKTVTGRNCKFIINASSDNALLLDRINRNADMADAADARSEIEENANTGPVLEIETEPMPADPAGGEPGQPEAGPEEAAIVSLKCPSGGVEVTEHYCKNECMDLQTCPIYAPAQGTADKGKKGPKF